MLCEYWPVNVNSELGISCLVVVPVVAPSDIGGGGGTSKELTITWTVGLANAPSLFLSLPVDCGHKLSFSPKSDLTAARSKPMESSISRSFAHAKYISFLPFFPPLCKAVQHSYESTVAIFMEEEERKHITPQHIHNSTV